MERIPAATTRKSKKRALKGRKGRDEQQAFLRGVDLTHVGAAVDPA
jgi:hypothetical protein